MNGTFKQFHKLNIPLIKRINKLFIDKNYSLLESDIDQLSDYKVCAVGSIRERLGLSPKYEFTNDSDFCIGCKEIAKEIPDPIIDYHHYKVNLQSGLNWSEKWETERNMKECKEKYEGLLLELKQHLKLEHNKELI